MKKENLEDGWENVTEVLKSFRTTRYLHKNTQIYITGTAVYIYIERRNWINLGLFVMFALCLNIQDLVSVNIIHPTEGRHQWIKCIIRLEDQRVKYSIENLFFFLIKLHTTLIIIKIAKMIHFHGRSTTKNVSSHVNMHCFFLFSEGEENIESNWK